MLDMSLKNELIRSWASIKMPRGFVADIESTDQAHAEYKDVEDYFSGRSWDDVDPEADGIRYMCPLLWMTEEAAKYYALSYLVYLLSPESTETEYDTPGSAVHYFESGFSILRQLDPSQKMLAEQVISGFKTRENT